MGVPANCAGLLIDCPASWPGEGGNPPAGGMKSGKKGEMKREAKRVKQDERMLRSVARGER
jgi:hypothetical protein